MRLATIVFVSLIGISFCSANETVDEALENPGECPPVTWLSSCSPPISHDCVVDVDCGYRDKCCYNGCYMTCKAPYPGHLKKRPRMCAQPVDLAFMIDSSESFGFENFQNTKKMLDKTLNLFTISEKKTHVAVVVIDSVPHIELNFNTLKGANITMGNVMEVVDGLQFIRGQTRIDLALRMAQKEVFSKIGGARKDSKKILLVFTDGVQTWDPRAMYSLKKLSKRLTKTGVQIFPVAVWDEELNIGTLIDMTSNTRNIFNTEFFPDLLALLKQISKGPCSGESMDNPKIFKRLLKKSKKE